MDNRTYRLTESERNARRQQRAANRTMELEKQARQDSEKAFRQAIIDRGALTPSGVVMIDPIGIGTELTLNSDTTPVYSSTLRLFSESKADYLAYGAAGSYTTLVVTDYANESRYDLFASRTNMPLIDVQSNVKYSDVSIFMNKEGKFLMPRKVDVIQYRPGSNMSTIFNAMSTYDVTVLAYGYFSHDDYMRMAGIARCIVEPSVFEGSHQYVPQTSLSDQI